MHVWVREQFSHLTPVEGPLGGAAVSQLGTGYWDADSWLCFVLGFSWCHFAFKGPARSEPSDSRFLRSLGHSDASAGGLCCANFTEPAKTNNKRLRFIKYVQMSTAAPI